MARHSLFPGFIKITYTSNTHVHHQVLPIGADPTPVGDSFTIPTRGSGAVDWTVAVDEWAALLAGILCGEASIDLAELYNFEAEPGPADFLQAYEVAVVGTHGGTAVPFAQAVFPFKGAGGTSLRVTILEGSEPPEIHVPVSGLGGADLALVNFVLSDDDFIVTRAGGFPSVSLGMVTKTNDVLRKRYFNP